MAGPRDPIQRADREGRDLYDVASWEPRTAVDWLAVTVHRVLVGGARVAVVLLAILIVVAEFALTGVATIEEPLVGGYVLFSVVPAFLLAVYVWRADVTRREPLRLLVGTFLLGFLFAGFAAVVNSLMRAVFGASLVGLVLFFFVVVAPVEETVKWLAVRLYAYRHDAFEAVVDGAVYGAIAGLGFATIENTAYITRQYLATAGAADAVLLETFEITAARTLAGPGHVIYSAFAGYYLGLAKFNRRSRGPIVVKGLLVAAAIHALYNTSVTFLDAFHDQLPVLAGLSDAVVFVGFVAVFDGFFGLLLYRKLARYRHAYRDVGADRRHEPYSGTVEREEFERDA